MKIWIDGSGWNGKESKYCVLLENSEPILHVTKSNRTNNEMEYEALLKALTFCSQKNEKYEIFSDSKLVVEQTLGNWRVREKRLQAFADKAKELMKTKIIILRWISRKENRAGIVLDSLDSKKH